MFSLDMINQRQYVNVVKPIAATTPLLLSATNGKLPGLSSLNSPASEQVDTSQLTKIKTDFGRYTSAQDNINGEGTPDVADIYTNGYRLSYLAGLQNLPDNKKCFSIETNGKKIIRSYTGNAVVPINKPFDIAQCKTNDKKSLLQTVIFSPCNK